MKIVLDGRPLVKQATGVATCLRDMIIAICDYLPKFELIIVVPRPIHSSITGLPTDKIQIVVSPLSRWINIPNFIWYHLKFPYLANRLKADVVWGTNVELPLINLSKHSKHLITVCDVVWKEYQDTMSRTSKYVYVPFLDRSVRNADLIYSISSYTKDKIEAYFPNMRCKEIFVGISCNKEFKRRAISDIRRKDLYSKYDLNGNFLLFVGSLEPRKNLAFLLQLMPDIYAKTGIKLLVVGGKGWKNNDIHTIVDNDVKVRESVVFANYVDFEELVDLYNIATCYVSTSLNEGFGLPQLEAMMCGCPVVSPHNSAMIEVVEGRGVTIKGWNHKEWVSVIERIVKDNEYRQSLCNPDLSSFRWMNIMKRLENYLKL